MSVSEASSAAASAAQPPEQLPRLLASVRDDGQPTSLAEHVQRYDPVSMSARGSDLISIVDESGLRGRGGGGFPTGTKFRAVAAQRTRPIVVANGAEGEPASGKDRALMRSVPHLVLDGAVLAAVAVGAQEIVIAVGTRASAEQRVLWTALDERRRARIDGRVRLQLAVVPDGFVAGEETALVQSLNHGPAKPTFVPPRPFERGVNGAATLVQNVETLAHVALIARYGARWFRRLGTADEPGSALVTVSGAVARAGIHEIPLGIRFADLLGEAGSLTEAAAAFLVGGYFGSWLRPESASELIFSNEDLGRLGGGLGAGVVVAVPRSTCAVAEVARVASYLADQSAGQCGPCVHGLRAIALAWARLAAGDRDERKRLLRWAKQVHGRGACRHPDGATGFVASALQVFSDEIDLHLRYGRCAAQDRGVLRVAHRGRARR